MICIAYVGPAAKRMYVCETVCAWRVTSEPRVWSYPSAAKLKTWLWMVAKQMPRRALRALGFLMRLASSSMLPTFKKRHRLEGRAFSAKSVLALFFRFRLPNTLWSVGPGSYQLGARFRFTV